MPSEFCDIDGLIVPPSALALRRAVELAAALSSSDLPYAHFVESRRNGDAETIVFDVEVERPQVRTYSIGTTERLAAAFDASDSRGPEILALRSDFPLVPHLNIREQEFPRSICLDERPWSEQKLTWSAPSFVEHLRSWLALTARGELHQEDQTLEPLMLSSGLRLILPANLDLNSTTEPMLLAVHAPEGKAGRVLVAETLDKRGANGQEIPFVALSVETPPRCHGVIRRTPKTLADLCELARTDEYELIDELRNRFKKLPEKKPLDALFILIARFPKTRVEGGSVETVELKAFLTARSLREFGVEIGVWALVDGHCSRLLETDETRNGSAIKMDVVNVSRTMSWQAAALLNGLHARNDTSIFAIGAGALGSQVAMNMARAGFGKWTIADDDELLPHNLARHALPGVGVGCKKAPVLAFTMNSLSDDEPIAEPLTCDVLKPGERAEARDAALGASEVVLDMSASVPVARFLAAREDAGRVVSMFLSPTGHDLIVLAEDRERRVRVDHLEMMYYSAVACDTRLANHLIRRGERIRYGGSCRDVSSRIPQHLFATLAGVGAAAIPRIAEDPNASIAVWRSDEQTGAVSFVDVSVQPFVIQPCGNWRAFIAPKIVSTVADLRAQRLPNETGGILMGSVDYEKKAVYVLLALPSPTDSEEWPTMYVRGCEGLISERERIREQTLGNVDYLGEWHSHPPGAATNPSAADEQVFEWIRIHVFVEGRPPVMLIAGQDGEMRLFVDEIPAQMPEPLCPH